MEVADVAKRSDSSHVVSPVFSLNQYERFCDLEWTSTQPGGNVWAAGELFPPREELDALDALNALDALDALFLLDALDALFLLVLLDLLVLLPPRPPPNATANKLLPFLDNAYVAILSWRMSSRCCCEDVTIR